MKKTPLKGDAHRAQTLQGLRAGPMTNMEMTERWSFGNFYATEMVRKGLAEIVGDEYRITPAGRAACPSRNPLAAKPATPEIFTMPKGETKLHRQQVLDFITAAGAFGTSRKALMEKFGHLVVSSAIDNHISDLHNLGAIFKPRPGHMVASTIMADSWIPEPLATDPPAAHDIHGISLAVDHHEVADLPAPSLAAQMAQIGGRLPAIVEDMTLDDPDTVEFALYSSGGLDIFAEDCAITLQAPVLAKLRTFLGTLKEAA